MAVLSTKLIISAAGLLTLWPAMAESPVGATRPQTVASVTIEHQLVDAVELPARPVLTPRRRAPLPTRRAAVQFAAAASRPVGFAARAGRIFFGDGRYRPEPFPRHGR